MMHLQRVFNIYKASRLGHQISLKLSVPQCNQWVSSSTTGQSQKKKHLLEKDISRKMELAFYFTDKWWLHSAYVSLALCTPFVMSLSAHELYNHWLFGTWASDRMAGVIIDLPLMFILLPNVLCILLLTGVQLIKQRTFFRIYYNSVNRNFIGIKFNWFMAKTYVTFEPGDVIYKSHSSSFSKIRYGNFLINSKPYFLPLNDFKNVFYYNVMVGNIKPAKEETKG